MADIRALMAQERQARRINHEFASYTKTGALTCTACQLSIKSETLWDGHLRSANHKANVKKSHQTQKATAKRKIEDVELLPPGEESDARKKLKPKSRVGSESINDSISTTNTSEDGPIVTRTQEPASLPPVHNDQPTVDANNTKSMTVNVKGKPPAQVSTAEVDENEWAAFERDVAALAHPDYSAATITAAPVSAAQLEADAESDRRRLRDAEAEDEQEEEGRRIEEEFDIMEEMEERVRKLKEKREALRSLGQVGSRPDQMEEGPQANNGAIPQEAIDQNSDESEDEADDWYS